MVNEILICLQIEYGTCADGALERNNRSFAHSSTFKVIRVLSPSAPPHLSVHHSQSFVAYKPFDKSMDDLNVIRRT